MKLRILFSFALLFLTPMLGCGSSSPPPSDGRSNLPPEVQAEENKFDADNAKRVDAYNKKTGKK